MEQISDISASAHEPAARTAGKAPPPLSSSSIAATAPGQLKVIKRNGTVVPYDESKIAIAITKAFLAVEGPAAAASGRIHQTVSALTAMVIDTFRRRMPSGGSVHIEDIQDQVELALMRQGEHNIARSYVIYREDRARERAARKTPTATVAVAETTSGITVVHPDGSRRPLDLVRLHTLVDEACAGLKDVEPSLILDEALPHAQA